MRTKLIRIGRNRRIAGKMIFRRMSCDTNEVALYHRAIEKLAL